MKRRKRKKKITRYCSYLFSISFCFLLLIVIASGNQKMSITTYNVNNKKSIQAVRMADQYNALLEAKKPALPLVYQTFDEAVSVSKTGQSASFIGKLTGYGPDCKGCGGSSACPPRQNFKNGNIYFNDATYGKIRIVAADRSLPCGSIVRIHNISIYNDPIIAIVMDRGGAIRGNHLDLLFETEKNMQGMYTHHNIQFDILRIGF